MAISDNVRRVRDTVAEHSYAKEFERRSKIIVKLAGNVV